MAGRICIPIHNERGELVAYAGRWPGEDVPEDTERYKLPAKLQKTRRSLLPFACAVCRNVFSLLPWCLP